MESEYKIYNLIKQQIKIAKKISIKPHIDEKDYTITNFVDITLDEIIKSNKYNLITDIETNKIYIARIYDRYRNIYIYKINFTKNILETLIEINNIHNSCGRIILLFVASIKSFIPNIETILVPYKITDSIDEYKISGELHDKLNNINHENYVDIFKSNKYVIDENDNETYLLSEDEIKLYETTYNDIIDYMITETVDGIRIFMDTHLIERLFWLNKLY
jgi:hypothetical protein